MRPIWFAWNSVNHIAPSGPVVMFEGCAAGVGRGNSVTAAPAAVATENTITATMTSPPITRAFRPRMPPPQHAGTPVVDPERVAGSLNLSTRQTPHVGRR